MDDLSFRAEFRRALDPMVPPAPWLTSAVRDRLRRRRSSRLALRGALRGLDQPAWLLPLVAVLLIVAILIAAIAGSRIFHSHSIPVRPPQHGLAGPAQCPAWSTSTQSGGLSGSSDRMTTPSVGWASGALRTTDRGAHWRTTAPAEMFSEAPRGTDPAAYPPAYNDFFLDSDHAWLAYGYPSKTSCFDHVTVFSTSDGGAAWRRSPPFNPPIQADTSLQLQLFFVDSEHGWLFVLAEGRLAPDWFVYATSDGGQDWRQVSQMSLMSSFCSVEFISLTVGFLGGCLNTSGPTPSLTATRDGGQTWTAVILPATKGNMFQVLAPVFFDQNHGVVHVSASTFQGNTQTSSDYLAATDDGGLTWHALQPFSFPGYVQAIGFSDPDHFVALSTDDKSGMSSIYVTADAGRTWTHSAGVFPGSYQTYPEISFVDPNHGFLELPSPKLGAAPFALYATADAGRTWMNMNPHLS